MKISYSDVESFCNELHALAKRMKESVEEIRLLGEKANTQGYWVGDASNYYRDELKRLSKNFDSVFTDIENSILFMAKSAGSYQEVDATVMREICEGLHITEPRITSNIFRG